MEDDKFEDYTQGYVPPNTTYNTQKCVKLFTEWAEARNECFQENQVPRDILSSTNKKEFCRWLCHFAAGVSKTIHHYLMDIQRHIRQITKLPINLLSDTEFLQLRNLLDTLYRKLHQAGVGTFTKRTPVLSPGDEDKRWALKLINPETPQGLLNCVLFLNGKNFCLRGCSEHHDLKLSQLRLVCGTY